MNTQYMPTHNRGFVTIIGIILTLLVLGGAVYLILNDRPVAKGKDATLGTPFTLLENEFVDIENEGLRVKVTGFINSPCPEGAACIWEGLAVKLAYTKNGKTEEGANLLEAFGYFAEIKESDYETKATLVISKGAVVTDRKVYASAAGGFEVTYPAAPALTLERAATYPAHAGQTKVDGDRLVHTVALEHCDSRGDACDPKTDNVSIGFFVLTEKFDLIKSKLEKDFAGEITKKTIGDSEALVVELGAEGEGSTHYYIPRGEKTVLITESYIDETVIGSYKDKPEFVTRANQRKLFEDIIGTLVWK